MRRVVVTGMGIACPLGLGVEHVWRRLINGESGITAIQRWMNGSEAMLTSWRRASSSSGTPRVHSLIGTPPDS